MSVVEWISTVPARVQGFLRGGFSRGAIFVVLGVALFAQVTGGARPAAADDIGSVQAQADQLAGEIAAQGQRIHAVTEQYQQAQGQEQSLSQQVDTASAQLDAARSRVDASYAELRRQAVAAYVHGSTAPGALEALLSGDPAEASVRDEYLVVANGDVHDTVDDLHVQEQTLKAKEAQLDAARQAEQGVLVSLDQDRQSLAAEASTEQATLDRVQGQLSQMVAQAEEAKLVAEQQAQQRAQQAPARTTVAEAPPPAVTAPPGGGQPTAAGIQALASAPPTLGGGGGGSFAAIRQCESGGDYSTDTGNGYYGAYQISAATWASLGYSGLPSQASPATQDAAAEALEARSGWGQWPTCAASLGLV